MTYALPPTAILPTEPEARTDSLTRSLALAVGTDQSVALGEIIDQAHGPLTAAIGRSPDGEAVALDIARLPHLAVAGASGSGKSTLIHTILASLLMVSDPDQLQLVMVDVTGELEEYKGLPHLVVDPIDDVEQGIGALEGLGGELERRYALLQRHGARNIAQYNETAPEGRLPWVLCVIDEFAELMLGGDKARVEKAVSRLGIRGRKCGIHLILATQIPHATVLTPPIKANMTGRVALTMPSAVFSRVAVDQAGAEKLHGRGDALLRDGTSVQLQRFQSAYLTSEMLAQIVEYWTGQVRPAAQPEQVEATDSHQLTVEPPRVPVPAGLRTPAVRFTPVTRPARMHNRLVPVTPGVRTSMRAMAAYEKAAATRPKCRKTCKFGMCTCGKKTR